MISQQGINFIKRWEHFEPFLYPDPYGHTTIGYGHLVHKGPINGSEPAEFKAGISRDRGEQILRKDIQNVVREVQRTVKVQVTQRQFDALVSYGFNRGTGNLAGPVDLLNAGDVEGAAKVIESGPIPVRRAAEASLFRGGAYEVHGVPVW